MCIVDNVSSELVWILKRTCFFGFVPREEMGEIDNLSQFQSVFNSTKLVEFLLKLGESKFSIYYFEYLFIAIYYLLIVLMDNLNQSPLDCN